MKKPFLIFTLKCSVILYFAACTSINEYANNNSATPRITKGTWKINSFTDGHNNKTTAFNGYTISFDPSGKLIATKNGERTIGNWSEDDILKRITINLNTKDAALNKLNHYWDISNLSKSALSLQNTENPEQSRLEITNR